MAAPPARVLEGIRLFNDGEYYECHEVIEHEWHAETRPIRRLYQGILQIGVGFLHIKRGNHTGALLLLNDGIEKTSEFTPACWASTPGGWQPKARWRWKACVTSALNGSISSTLRMRHRSTSSASPVTCRVRTQPRERIRSQRAVGRGRRSYLQRASQPAHAG